MCLLPVIPIVWDQLSLALAVPGLSLLFGPPQGILAGLRPGSWLGRGLQVLSSGHKAAPQFPGSALVPGLGFVPVNALIDLALRRIDPRGAV